MLEAVLFDWGETLMSFAWDEEVALTGTRAALAAVARAELPPAEAVVEWFSLHEADLGQGEDELDIAAVMQGCFSDLGCSLGDDDVRLYLQTTEDTWEQAYSLGATTHALLDSLRGQGLKLGLVSNTARPEWLLRPVLERQGLTHRFDTIVLSSEVGKRKPHRAIFERALADLSVEPARALFVGDRLREDVTGAAATGMRTVQALWFRADDVPAEVEPDFQAFTQMDVLNIVRRLGVAYA